MSRSRFSLRPHQKALCSMGKRMAGTDNICERFVWQQNMCAILIEGKLFPAKHDRALDLEIGGRCLGVIK